MRGPPRSEIGLQSDDGSEDAVDRARNVYHCEDVLQHAGWRTQWSRERGQGAGTGSRRQRRSRWRVLACLSPSLAQARELAPWETHAKTPGVGAPRYGSVESPVGVL